MHPKSETNVLHSRIHQPGGRDKSSVSISNLPSSIMWNLSDRNQIGVSIEVSLGFRGYAKALHQIDQPFTQKGT